jgi:hypothetical protein
MFSPVSVHQELSEKQKPPTHQGGGLQSSGGDLFSEFPHHTSSETFVPDQGHLSSPLPGCQTRLRVVPDAGSNRNEPVSAYNKNLCHMRKPASASPIELWVSRIAGSKTKRFQRRSGERRPRTFISFSAHASQHFESILLEIRAVQHSSFPLENQRACSPLRRRAFRSLCIARAES